MILALLVVNASMTWFMTGVIWLVQVVHYPIFDTIPADRFKEFAERHCRLTTRVVALPMVTEALSSALLVAAWSKPERAIVWLGFALVLSIWFCTLVFSVPSHNKFCQSGYVASTHQFLLTTNWIRTWLWTLRSALTTYLICHFLRP